MNRLALCAAVLLSLSASKALAHCQVPCGIYGDQRQFDEMMEDTATIAKAISEIGKLSGTHDATGHNQLARWVANKEKHAANVQETIASYFLAQRIKPDAQNYTQQLKTAHAVIIAAMKAKQAADPATAVALEKSIKDLYVAYKGKPYQPAHDPH